MLQSPSRVRPGQRWPLAFLLAFLAASAASPVPGSAQGLTYSFSPSARWIEWDEDLSFKRSRLLGGSVGMGFGRYVGLNAFHYQEDGLNLFDGLESDPAHRSVDLAQSGVQVSLALGSGTIVPVLVGGGSLLKFEPQGGDRLKKLSLDYGVGFRTVFGEVLQGEVLLESTQYRLDSSVLSTGEPSIEGTGPLRRNMTLRTSLGLQVGRRSFDKASELDDAFAQRYQAPFANFALAVEPLLGRLNYDSSLGLENQEMVGVRAGVDFGSFFGLRGFHWWGTASDFQSTTDLRAWGGEAQFTLASGPGLNPYLAGGAGQLSWGKAEEDEAPRPQDQTALILGGGLDFNFGPRIRATVAARDFILAGSNLSASPGLNTVADPDDLVHNWQFSAGLKFLIGRSGIRSGTPVGPQAQGGPVPVVRRGGEESSAATDSLMQTPAATQATPPSAYPDPTRTIVLPVLERGEIYIRFGEAGSVPLITALRAQGDTATAVAAGAEQTGPTLEDIRRLIQEELARTAAATPARSVAPSRPEAASASAGSSDPMKRRVEELRPYAGFHLTGDRQTVIGLSADIGPVRPGSRLRFLPQVALGVGHGPTSFLVEADMEFRLPELDVGRKVTFEPLLSMGPGLIKRDRMELQLGLFLGSGARIYRDDGSLRFHLFGGVQGVDFFNDTRIILGIRRLR